MVVIIINARMEQTPLYIEAFTQEMLDATDINELQVKGENY
ncbi:hypothetical protein [Sporosarcina sp. SG10008]